MPRFATWLPVPFMCCLLALAAGGPLPLFCLYLLVRHPEARGAALRGLAVAPLLVVLFLGALVSLPFVALLELAKRISPDLEAVVPMLPPAWRKALDEVLVVIIEVDVRELGNWMRRLTTVRGTPAVEAIVRPAGFVAAADILAGAVGDAPMVTVTPEAEQALAAAEARDKTRLSLTVDRRRGELVVDLPRWSEAWPGSTVG